MNLSKMFFPVLAINVMQLIYFYVIAHYTNLYVFSLSYPSSTQLKVSHLNAQG